MSARTRINVSLGFAGATKLRTVARSPRVAKGQQSMVVDLCVGASSADPSVRVEVSRLADERLRVIVAGHIGYLSVGTLADVTVGNPDPADAAKVPA